MNKNLVPLKYIEVTIIMAHVMKSRKYGTEYGNIYGLFDGISLQQEDVTPIVYLLIVVYGELNMSNMKSVMWFL